MSKSKLYKNLKGQVTSSSNIPAAAAGPYTVGTSATWFFAGVPCMGARQITYTIRGAGAGALASQTCIMGNHSDGSDVINFSSSDVVLRGDGGFGIGTGNGLRVSVLPSAGLHLHGFCFFSIVNDATANKTGVSVDAEVWYEGEADPEREGYGQSGVAAATY